MACELWVKGEAWTGSSRIAIDIVWRSNWNGTIPNVAPVRPASGGSTVYSDGLDGEFNGTGWFGSPVYYLNGCGSSTVPSNQPYDCINGGCIPKTTYNTPGAFANLAACQSGCAKNSNCSGECVPAAELAALQQAANDLNSRYCK